ncbi:class I adenylate-forming enzyme family protein [Hyphomonas johnsonii]|uniref:3-methylmercaptopropionyl-CoA ligase n=1 Tax=Hyphomonas johnsonii MHS-2 TaxID=1280950 RepID=A0A059FDY4_9PROT|nr:long-chain-fatty-acid--CoA ligase [Hyphomonas johnsonii]KCZ88850.1 AMP-dependent synthetase and ligase [Hyphomonas johnsonii MHS-2]
MRITQALVRAATVRSEGVATIDGERTHSWDDILQRVSRIAGALRTIGVAKGDRVAILSNNSDRFFQAYFAIPWAGGVMVPLNTRLAVAELDFQLRDAGVGLLLYGRDFDETARRLKAAGAVTHLLPMDEEQKGSLPYAALNGDRMDECVAERASLAGIFYTGGTTGLPKGVMLSHDNLCTTAMNLMAVIPFDESCVNLHASPMFHLADIGILFCTLSGGTHVFVQRFDGQNLLGAMAEHGVTHCFTVPAIIDQMVQSPLVDTLDLSALRLLGYGGSAMPVSKYVEARARFPAVDFIQGFGQTEMPAATFLSPRAHRDAPDHVLASVGKVCPGYEIRVVDKTGAEVPRGVTGEIVGRGDNVMMGYWNRPEETAQVKRAGWLHTGDAGYMDEAGYIYITDRLKDMIITGAENVYSQEVENALNWHPDIAEAAVIGVPDEKWGERVHAVIVLREGKNAPTAKEVADFCRQHIAGYKCPKSIEIRSEPLPRSAAGKILKGPLRDIYSARTERTT